MSAYVLVLVERGRPQGTGAGEKGNCHCCSRGGGRRSSTTVVESIILFHLLLLSIKVSLVAVFYLFKFIHKIFTTTMEDAGALKRFD